MTTKPKGERMAAKDGYEVIVTFLRSVADARNVEEVNVAAGIALQDLEEADIRE